MTRRPRPMTATYRLQLHGLGFRKAAAIVPYLRELGVSHVYTSPFSAAQQGSTHGYDVVDPTRQDPALGSPEDFELFTRALDEHGMGLVVDVVPNHMAASVQNAWWADVLENGEASLHADRFDVEWCPRKAALEGKVLLAWLAAPYGEVLERGDIRLVRDGGAFFVRYLDLCIPAEPSSTAPFVARAAARLTEDEADPRRAELESIASALAALPSTRDSGLESRRARAREKEVQKRRLATAAGDPEVAAALDATLDELVGRPDDPRSFDALDELLRAQCFRLAYWRVSTEEINYRRFFDVDGLVAVRAERDEVFEEIHRLPLELVRKGVVDGLRIDHVDGLRDPRAYLTKLRAAMSDPSLLLVVEKILAPGEQLADWPVDGTTGYDFLALASGLFVDRGSEQAFTRLLEDVTGDDRSFRTCSEDAKRRILRSVLSSELHMLAQKLERIASGDRRSRDFTLASLERALAEILVAFPTYRTYGSPEGEVSEADARIVRRAVARAKRACPEVSPAVFAFVQGILLHEPGASAEARRDAALRVQQLTGPVMAKGVEDTAFYEQARLVALNEVGGAPEIFGTTAETFHAESAERRRRFPRAMLATSTHDTKRAEDVRARLAVLSEVPEAWARFAKSFLDETRDLVRTVDDEEAPSTADRYALLQTMVGALPFGDARDASGAGGAFADRVAAYALKAAREAKRRTSWLSPNGPYEEALDAWVRGVIGSEAHSGRLRAFASRLFTHGASNGLALAVLALASPGLTDRYQGSEIWDLRLVDPDNRTPVDFARLASTLKRVREERPSALRETYEDGAVKLLAIHRGLAARRAHAELFVSGSYEPVVTPDELLAFERASGSGRLVCAVTTRPLRVTRGEAPWAIGDVWGQRRIPVTPGTYRDVITGLRVEATGSGAALRELFAELPVALLVTDG